MAAPPRREAAPDRSTETASARPATRTILKFDSGRRGFTRAIVILAVSAAGLLGFALYFFRDLL